MKQNPIIILDNGAYNAKIGIGNLESSSSECPTPLIAPNCLMKVRSESRHPAYVAEQVSEIKDLSSLYYQLAFQKGYLIHWDIQKQVWDRLIHHALPILNPNLSLEGSEILITVPPHNLSFIGESINEIFFEEYNLSACLQITSSDLSALHYFHDIRSSSLGDYKPPCSLIIDTGFSFTHLTHYLYPNKQNIPYSVQKDRSRMCRIDVGGKLLTNYYKEIISYRQLHVMDETYVINQLKEDTCFVSQDFLRDMEVCKKYGFSQNNPMACQYVLPDFQRLTRGYIREQTKAADSHNEYQILKLSTERISVPELLFHPSDVGIDEMGLAESVVESLAVDDDDANVPFCENIVLTGGNALISGISQRLAYDVRTMLNDTCTIKVHLPPNPVSYAWEGGYLLVNHYQDHYDDLKVSREDYFENGAHRLSFHRRNKLL